MSVYSSMASKNLLTKLFFVRDPPEFRFIRSFRALVVGMRSVYGKRFFQRLAVAVRTGWACLMAGSILLYGSPVSRWMAIPFFSLVIGINTVDSSLGSVLLSVWGVVLGMVQALGTGLFVYLILGTRLSLGPAVLCILVSSFCVAYPDRTPEMTRKVALSLIGILFTTAHSGQNGGSVYFLVRLMGTTLIGAACALLAVLVPFPGLASVEACKSAEYTVRGSSELFSTLVEAFCARDPSTFSSMLLHAQFLAKTTAISLQELNSQAEIRTEAQGAAGKGHTDDGSGYLRQVHAVWEVRAVGLLPSFKRMSKGLNGLKLHLLGMTLALQSGMILETPDAMSVLLRDDLKQVSHRTTSILQTATKLSKSKYLVREKAALLEKANQDLKSLDALMVVAREDTYYSKFPASCDEGSVKDDVLTGPEHRTHQHGVKRLIRTMVPTYFFLFNVRMYFNEAANMIRTGKIANKMHQIATSGHHIPSLDHDFASDRSPAMSPPSQPQPATDHLDHAKTPKSPELTCSHCQKLRQSHQGGASWLISCWNWLDARGLKPRRARFIRALKISMAMSLAALAGITYNKDYAFWANITVGFIIQNCQGGSFRMANLRLQGTVIGAIYGYLAMLVTKGHPNLVMAALIPWVILLSYLRFSKIFGAAGVIAGLTAAIVMLGGGNQQIQEFALNRIVENFIGVLFMILVETVVFPNRAVTLARTEMVSSLTDLRDCVAAVVAAYTGTFCSEHRRLVVLDIKNLEKQIRAKFAAQKILQDEAAVEPDLWNVPFPAETYMKLLQIQGRMLDFLYFMVCSLHATTEECISERIEKLVEPLQSSLITLEGEVLSSLDLLHQVLQVQPHEASVLKTKWSWNDEENNLRESDRHQSLSRPMKGSQGIQCGNIHKMVTHVHPLLLLECRQRTIDGTPLSLKSTMEAFEVSYEEVVSGFMAEKRGNPARPIVSNAAMLSFSALTFSLQSLLKDTVELEKAVHELLHFENPWSILDFWETPPTNDQQNHGALSQES